MLQTISVIYGGMAFLVFVLFWILGRIGLTVARRLFVIIAVCGVVLALVEPIARLLPMSSVDAGLCNRVEMTPQELSELKLYVNSEEAIKAATRGLEWRFSTRQLAAMQSCWEYDLSPDDPTRTDVYVRLEASGVTRSEISKLLQYAEQMKPLIHNRIGEIQR